MSWSARRSLVSHFVEKSLLRPKSRLELGALYVGCFLLASFLACVERQAAGSDVLLRYFEFMLHNKRAFVLGSLWWRWCFTTTCWQALEQRSDAGCW